MTTKEIKQELLEEFTARRHLAALKIILTGESTIDHGRMFFDSYTSVDNYLRLNQFDTDNPLDVSRLQELHREAIDYLEDIHELTIPEEIRLPESIHDLFLLASQAQRQIAMFACTTLKVMQILHHISGRELIFTSAISEASLFDRLSSRVFIVIDRMRASGISVLEFSGGKKTRKSMTTKLLAKRNTLATQIFDKARFGIVLKKQSDLVPTMIFLAEHLIPVNYIIPEQSINGIVTLGDIAAALPVQPQFVWNYWTLHNRSDADHGKLPTPPNEFSGRSYRCINFVADIPVRIDDIAPESAPAIAFVQAEFQLVDEETNKRNDQGENAHVRYKERQHQTVLSRLDPRNIITQGSTTRSH